VCEIERKRERVKLSERGGGENKESVSVRWYIKGRGSKTKWERERKKGEYKKRVSVREREGDMFPIFYVGARKEST